VFLALPVLKALLEPVALPGAVDYPGLMSEPMAEKNRS